MSRILVRKTFQPSQYNVAQFHLLFSVQCDPDDLAIIIESFITNGNDGSTSPVEVESFSSYYSAYSHNGHTLYFKKLAHMDCSWGLFWLFVTICSSSLAVIHLDICTSRPNWLIFSVGMDCTIADRKLSINRHNCLLLYTESRAICNRKEKLFLALPHGDIFNYSYMISNIHYTKNIHLYIVVNFWQRVNLWIKFKWWNIKVFM